MHLSTNLGLGISKRFSTLVLILLFRAEIDVRIAGRNYTVPKGERSTIGIVEQWFLLSVCQNSESRREDGLGGAHVPHFIPRYEIQKEVTTLIGKV